MTDSKSKTRTSGITIAGFVSSTISTVIINPLEVLKIKSHVTKPGFRTSTHTSKMGLRKGFFAGLSLNLMTRPVFWTMYFPAYNHLENNKNLPTPVAAYLAAGAGAVVSNPLWVAKMKIQTHEFSGRKSRKLHHVFRDIYRNEGIRGYYKGLGLTLISNGQLSVQFPLYHHLKKYLKDHTIGPAVGIICSAAIADICATLMFYPFEVVRTRIRSHDHHVTPLYEARKMIQEGHGFKVWYRGIHWSFAKSLPSFIVMMLMYEGIAKSITQMV